MDVAGLGAGYWPFERTYFGHLTGDFEEHTGSEKDTGLRALWSAHSAARARSGDRRVAFVKRRRIGSALAGDRGRLASVVVPAVDVLGRPGPLPLSCLVGRLSGVLVVRGCTRAIDGCDRSTGDPVSGSGCAARASRYR